MNQSTRRDFLKTSTGIATIAFAGTSFNYSKNKPLLSFSTLGCPDWTFGNIVNFAAENKYDGIELRGIQRQLDLTKCKEFSNPENIKASIRLMEQKDLRFVDLGSSAALHYSDITERNKNMDEAKRFIDLAHQLKCPYIRVFPNNLPKDRDRDMNLEIISKGLLELGAYAKGSDVTVLMETHGDLIESADIEKIMQSAEHIQVGLIWDIVNMWSRTKEPPGQVYVQLKKYIRHTHIKDVKIINGKEQYTFLGEGDAPVFEAIDILYKGGYTGYYSFEWEKLWHPEIPEPDKALVDYSRKMKEWFNK